MRRATNVTRHQAGHLPEGTPATRFLDAYGARLTAVEGNTTFYAVPSVDVLRKWAQQTPDGFRFCLELPKTVTHDGPLAAQVPAALW